MLLKPKTILLMRHAKSSWDDPSLKDISRPLNNRGNADAPAMAKWLKAQTMFPGQVFCSPAVRTRQTLQHVQQILNIPDESISFEESMYFSGVQAYLDVIKSAASSSSLILLIGHNPMTESAVHLLSKQPVKKPIKTATIAHLTAHVPDWAEMKPESCALNRIQSPKELDDFYR